MPVDGQYFSRTYDLGPLRLAPLTPLIGAEADGVDLRAPLPPEARAAIGEAMRRHKVLFFREQALARAELVAFARGCGTLLTYADGDRAHPELKVFDYGAAQRGREAFWHFDVLPSRQPARAAVLQARLVPDVGGDTLFCDLAAVHASLPEALRARLENAVGRYDVVLERRLARFRGRPEEEVMAIRPEVPLDAMPLVHAPNAAHGDARPILFVNPGLLVGIDGWSAAESRELLADLRERIARPDFQCRHRWRAGDVALWDNLTCLHYATNNYWPQRRTMERVTLLDLRGLHGLDAASAYDAPSVPETVPALGPATVPASGPAAARPPARSSASV